VENLPVLLIVVAVLVLIGLSGLMQHRYYARTIRRLVGQYNRPGLALVSGVGKGRLRGAVAVLVLRPDTRVIEHAEVMQGTSVLARFRARPEWVGLRADGDLPGATKKVAAAVSKALEQLPKTSMSGKTPR
jgi:DNA-binding transcriptional regulator of glucitol operon